jgi:hypothetical protein
MKRFTGGLLVASLAAFASGAALADGDGGDNGMTPYYGDSWADLIAHTGDMPSGPMQALQDREEAQKAWAATRERMHVQAERWRDHIAHLLHHDEPNG